MEIINKPRGSGKTYDLILLSEMTQCPIICAYSKQAEILLNKARDMNATIPIPMSVTRYKTFLECGGKPFDSVLIDELNTVLENLLQTPVLVATISGTVISNCSEQ